MTERAIMPDPLEIVPATAADLDPIHRLEVTCFPSPWRREFFESELQGNGRMNLVVRLGGKIVGYLFSMWFFDEMHVNKIAVAEDQRRRGVARALMEHCLEFARHNQIKTISLEVRQSNRGAQDFYNRLDFASLYVRPRYYPDGEAAVVMVKQLPSS